MDRGQHLTDDSVEALPARRADAGVRDLAELVVGEVVAWALLPDDLASPQIVEGVRQGVFVDTGGRAEHVDREPATNGCRDLDQPSGFGGQASESRADDRLDRGGQARVADASGESRAGSLDHKERIAFGFPPELLAGDLIQGAAGEARRQLGGGVAVETIQGNFGQGVIPPEPRGQHRQWVVVVYLLGADGRGDEEWGLGHMLNEEADELDRVRVGPLEVVDDQEQRRSVDEHHLRNGIEELAPANVNDARCARNVWSVRPQLGEEASQLDQPRPIQMTDAGAQGVASQPVDRWSPRQTPSGFIRPCPCDGIPLGRDLARQLVDQPALADPGLARDEQQVGSPGSRRPPHILGSVALGVATDQRGGPRRCAPGDCRERCRGCAAPRTLCLVQLTSGGVGLDSQLAFEDLDAAVVHAQRLGSVASAGEGLHRQPIRGLAQRIESQQPLRVLEDADIVAPVSGVGRESPDAVDGLIAEPVALAQRPVVVAAGQEVSAVCLVGRGEVLSCDRLSEGDEIDVGRGVTPPPETLTIDIDVTVGVGQGVAQVVQQLAQIRPSLALGGVRPQLERESAPAQDNARVEGQVGEQTLEPRRGELLDRLAVDANDHLAQQPDLEPRPIRCVLGPAHRVERPRFRKALQLMIAPIGERHVGATDQIANDPRRQDLAARRSVCDPSRRVDGFSEHVAVDTSNVPSVDADTNLRGGFGPVPPDRSRRWISMAAATAARAEPKTTRQPSPVPLTIVPP